MEAKIVKSTSLSSAVSDDIVLRETHTTRLIFRPMLVTNPKNQAAAVKGIFIFQRKGSSGTWEDVETLPLSKLKKHEGVKLVIKSSELLKLYEELTALYEIYRAEGIPLGETRFIRASRTVKAVAEMSDEELTEVVRAKESMGSEALARLIRWASKADNFSLMFERLESLELDSLYKLNAAVGISTFKRALKTWSKNRNNADEEFWQNLLANHSFVLEQIFYFPIVIIKSKAYVGGKSVLNRGGNLVDFLIKNKVTKAVGLIEIKTLKTPLLGSRYRDEIYNISSELSGAVLQVLSYRENLTRERDSLLRGQGLDLESFDPKCVVIIGRVDRELDSPEKKQGFEIFRRQMSDVEIITYDEVFERIKRLVELLEGRTQIESST